MAARDTTIRDRHRQALRAKRLPCALCGEPIDYDLKWPDPDSFVVDHIQPIRHGGADVIGNKQPAHARCNRAKWDSLDSPVLKVSGVLR